MLYEVSVEIARSVDPDPERPSATHQIASDGASHFDEYDSGGGLG
jgi:hypothetical protein